MEQKTQLRKMNMMCQRELEHILDSDDLWEKLMCQIPKTLYPDPSRACLSSQNPPKYNTEHFKIIKTVSSRSNRSCTNIMFDEWGTSGRVLPTLGHLRHLLVKAGIYRAADYLSAVIGLEKPDRPATGPEAVVPIPDIPENFNHDDDHSEVLNGNDVSIGTDSGMIPPLDMLLEQSSVNIESGSNNISTQSISEGDSSEGNSSEQNFATSGDLPNLSIFDNVASIPPVSQDNKKSRSFPSLSTNKCPSPLPTLSLNTTLPQLSYQDLEKATNDFNDDPFTAEDNDGRLLGRGAFGAVYYALGLMDRPVAVKKLILKDFDSENMNTITKQFCKEIESLDRFKHDNLLTLLGFSCDGPTYCIVYEYISGGSLKDRLQSKENRLIWTDRLYIAFGTAKATVYLHTVFNVIHRDIKSANILLDANNKPKLGDFGLIRTFNHNQTNTFTTPIGTQPYMPIDAIRGEISHKTDTYSFGKVLLELLTALPVFDEERSDADLGDHVESAFEKGVEKALDKLLDKTAGTWSVNNFNVAEELFKIALKCLEDKKKRPIMVVVMEWLSDLLEKV